MVLNDELASAFQLSEANSRRGKHCPSTNGTTDICGIIYHGQDISLALVALLTPATHDVEPMQELLIRPM